MATDIRKELYPLEVLDLDKCKSVGTTVAQMEKCAIGARMIGEVTGSLEEIIKSGEKPVIVYDGKSETALGMLLRRMTSEKKWFKEIIRPDNLSKADLNNIQTILIIGPFSERFETSIYQFGGRTIFINNSNQFKPGQIKDGFFPDFIHGDPRLIMPIIFRALEERIEGRPASVVSLLKEMAWFDGPAAQASHGFETLKTMINDPDCTVIGTFSGIMTVSKMGGLISQMIDRGMVQGIAATGALICHGFVEGVGLKHYKYNPGFTDAQMAQQKLNRITDCVEPEENLDHVEGVLKHILNEKVSGEKPISPCQINFLIGEHLSKGDWKGSSILRSAYEKRIPVFIPASTDSELGNDIYIINDLRALNGKKPIIVDHEIDSRRLVKMAINAKTLGIFSIGGGVPRNNVQNVAPLIEIMSERLELDRPTRMFSYGCRIDPTLPYYGNLSGCTYSEGGSWRKMDLINGRFSEIQADGTMVFPFFMAGLVESQIN